MSSDDIRRYWDEKARTLRADPSATMKDVVLRTMEIEAVAERLRPEDDLLDVGAGNAFAAIRWSERCRSVLATDRSSAMVEVARAAVAESQRHDVAVEEADVLDLTAYAGSFSAVSCVRCLINLESEAAQLSALEQLACALRPAGRLFLIEGLVETFTAVNAARKEMGLPEIALNWHNRLLPRDVLEGKLTELLEIDERVDFGEYYFLSRVVHPLLVAPEEPRFEGRLNLIAREVWRRGLARGAFAGLSTLVLYVCRRREGVGA